MLEDSYHNCTLDRQRHVVVQRSAGFIESVLGQSEQVQERAKLREREYFYGHSLLRLPLSESSRNACPSKRSIC